MVQHAFGAHAVFFAVLAIAGLAALNLRGIRESGAMFAVPVYAFLASMIALIVWGLVQVEVLGRDLRRDRRARAPRRRSAAPR